MSVDPLTRSFPMLTPYQFASNTPVTAIDLDGLEASLNFTQEQWEDGMSVGISNHKDIEAYKYEEPGWFGKASSWAGDKLVQGVEFITEGYASIRSGVVQLIAEPLQKGLDEQGYDENQQFYGDGTYQGDMYAEMSGEANAGLGVMPEVIAESVVLILESATAMKSGPKFRGASGKGILIEVDGYAMVFDDAGSFGGRGWLDGAELNLLIDVRKTNLKGSMVFDDLFSHINKNWDEVSSVRGTWRKGKLDSNLKSFLENAKTMTDSEAALNTFTGKMATNKGFKNASVTRIKDSQGNTTGVDVIYSR